MALTLSADVRALIDGKNFATVATSDPGKTLPKTLSHKYLAQDPPPEGPEVERVVVRLKVDKVAGNVN